MISVSSELILWCLKILLQIFNILRVCNNTAVTRSATIIWATITISVLRFIAHWHLNVNLPSLLNLKYATIFFSKFSAFTVFLPGPSNAPIGNPIHTKFGTSTPMVLLIIYASINSMVTWFVGVYILKIPFESRIAKITSVCYALQSR